MGLPNESPYPFDIFMDKARKYSLVTGDEKMDSIQWVPCISKIWSSIKSLGFSTEAYVSVEGLCQLKSLLVLCGGSRIDVKSASESEKLLLRLITILSFMFLSPRE